MPIVAFAGVLGGLAVVRWAYKTAMRIKTLRRDPVTGAYRPG